MSLTSPCNDQKKTQGGDAAGHSDRRALIEALRKVAHKCHVHKQKSRKEIIIEDGGSDSDQEGQAQDQEPEDSGTDSESGGSFQFQVEEQVGQQVEEEELDLSGVKELISSAEEVLKEDGPDASIRGVVEEVAKWWDEDVVAGFERGLEMLKLTGAFCLAVARALSELA